MDMHAQDAATRSEPLTNSTRRVVFFCQLLLWFFLIALPFIGVLGGYKIGYEIAKEHTTSSVEQTGFEYESSSGLDDVSHETYEYYIAHERVSVGLEPLRDVKVYITVGAEKKVTAPPFEQLTAYNHETGHIELRDYHSDGEVIQLVQVFDLKAESEMETLFEEQTLRHYSIVHKKSVDDLRAGAVDDLRKLLVDPTMAPEELDFSDICSIVSRTWGGASIYSLDYPGTFGPIKDDHPFYPCGSGRFEIFGDLGFGIYSLPIDATEPKAFSGDIRVLE